MIHFHDIKIETQTGTGKHTKNLAILLSKKLSLTPVETESLIVEKINNSNNPVTFLKMIDSSQK